MLSDIFRFAFTLLLPNWLLISIRIYSGIARFPCDSMAFLFEMHFNKWRPFSKMAAIFLPAGCQSANNFFYVR